MCIIVYKPKFEKMPKEEVLKNCFENNSDGAGFMLTYKKQVMIEKGFKTYNDFKNALDKAVKKYGEDAPYVLHFRISTQGGTRQDCCHPYPLSHDMNDLRKLRFKTDIGIAHNGIISLTSMGYKTQVTYNDTMLFITDFLSLIIDDKKYYKDNKKLLLIERLVESRLAILDNDGHCELIGSGWIYEKDDGCYYSNSSYKTQKWIYNTMLDDNYDDWDKYENNVEYWESKYNAETNEYDFNDSYDEDCPLDFGEDYYCDFCSKCNKCKKLKAYIDELSEDFYYNKLASAEEDDDDDFEIVNEWYEIVSYHNHEVVNAEYWSVDDDINDIKASIDDAKSIEENEVIVYRVVKYSNGTEKRSESWELN